MPRAELSPVRMLRVAVVTPRASLRRVLVEVGALGVVEIDHPPAPPESPVGEATRRLQRLGGEPSRTPLVTADPPDLDDVQRDGRLDLLAGEAELEGLQARAASSRSVTALLGWCPAEVVPEVAARLAALGGSVVPLPRPAGVDPPTLLPRRGGVQRSFAPLVDTYATVPYADIDPTVVAGLAYIVMFGMMFGDLGHGLLLVGAALLLRSGRPRRFASARRVWPFVAGAGLAASVFGVLYGEFFGPTGVLPVLWLSPLEEPIQLLLAGLGFGALLLAGAYGLGVVNRWREGGLALALYSPSGIAGATVFLGLAIVVAGWWFGVGALTAAGVLVAAVGLGLAAVGLYTGSGGGGAGVAQTGVELFDLVVRLASNLVSFARLAAFGLMHAALGAVVWDGASGLFARGGLAWLAGAVVFVVGNLIAFALEALVAGVQALRLEYYELFSRVFESEGRPFVPWHLPTEQTLEEVQP